jgi:hypothetical protein
LSDDSIKWSDVTPFGIGIPTTLLIAEKLAFYGIATPIKAHITIRLGLVIIGTGISVLEKAIRKFLSG